MKFVLAYVGVILFAISSSFAQQSLKDKYFSEYELLLDKLQNKNAEVLAPENFKNAVALYKEANADYDNKKISLLDIKEKLEESRAFATKALNIVHLAEDTLSKPIKARELALGENAPLFAPELWEDAEGVFKEATGSLEDDDIDDALKYGARAYDLYLKAEVLSIKNSLLGDAETQLNLARNEEAQSYCMQTYRLAYNLLLEAKDILKKDPHAKEEARKKALQASYEARHAQYLARKIKSVLKNKAALEYDLLKMEAILSDISAIFHYDAKFDEGLEKPAKTILGFISSLKENEKELLKKNAGLEEKLNSLQESDATKTARIKERELLESKIDSVKELFKASEAQVVYQGNKLVIHLFGLYFAPGRAIIQPEYYSLLSKVQEAIKQFPEHYIMIEGHTDATGNAYKNKKLSQRRARAVEEYLLANLSIDPNQIEYLGLGDEKPIASNKTRQGRARNRRIDVIISLD